MGRQTETHRVSVPISLGIGHGGGLLGATTTGRRPQCSRSYNYIMMASSESTPPAAAATGWGVGLGAREGDEVVLGAVASVSSACPAGRSTGAPLLLSPPPPSERDVSGRFPVDLRLTVAVCVYVCSRGWGVAHVGGRQRGRQVAEGERMQGG